MITRTRTALCCAAIATFVSCCPHLANAQQSNASVPAKGDVAKDFELTAVAGKHLGTVKLSEAVRERTVVLVVLRGYPGYQCGICTRQVGQLVSKSQAFKEKDVDVLMVYPGPADQLESKADEFLKGSKLPVPFTLLIDPDYAFTNAYGLRWDAPNETAFPSTFIIGKDSKIEFATVSKGHGGRVSAEEILSQL